MFTIEMLPAGKGDCLWVEYGDPDAPNRVLIDGGIPATAVELRERIGKLSVPRFELIVLTHIDGDHIGGLLQLFRTPPQGFTVDDIWFNSWEHLPENEGILGAKDAERLAYILKGFPRNEAFGGKAAALSSHDKLREITLPGGMQITLLSPTLDRLANLRPVWEDVIRDAGLEPGAAGEALEQRKQDRGILGEAPDFRQLATNVFIGDNSEANGSSIAFVAEYEGKRCLFAGDAFATDLVDALESFRRPTHDIRVRLEGFKLSHHGGKRNTNIELLQKVLCSQYLFSTNGGGGQHWHPHAESVARVVEYGKECRIPKLYFNYRNERTTIWDNAHLYDGKYEPVFPHGDGGMKVELLRTES